MVAKEKKILVQTLSVFPGHYLDSQGPNVSFARY